MPSSVIESYHYHADTKVLVITFRSGAVYAYLDVPAEVYETFKRVKSRGIFLNRIIKKDYDFELIKAPDSQ